MNDYTELQKMAAKEVLKWAQKLLGTEENTPLHKLVEVEYMKRLDLYYESKRIRTDVEETYNR